MLSRTQLPRSKTWSGLGAAPATQAKRSSFALSEAARTDRKRLRHRQGTPRRSWRSREGDPLLLTAGYYGLSNGSPRPGSLNGRAGWRTNVRTRRYRGVAQGRISSVWALMRNRIDCAVARYRSASIRDAPRIGKHNYLGGLRVYDDLGRRHVIGWNDRRLLIHFRVGRRIRGDVSVPKTRACVRLCNDLLIVLWRDWSRLLVNRLRRFMIGLVVYRISRLKYVCDNRDGVQSALLHSCCGARFGGWETGVCQPGHDPDQNTEFDRNKICNFWVHFRKSLQAIDKYDGNQKELFLQSCENLVRNRRAQQS